MSEAPQEIQIPASLNETTVQSADKDPILLAKEIVDSRTAWYFRGRCANGTSYPEGQTNKAQGSEETRAANDGTEASYYNSSTSHIDVTLPKLYFAAKILPSAIRYGSREDPATLAIARTQSKIEGYDEVVITGVCASADERQDFLRYHLVNRLESKKAQELYDKLKVDPDFIDVFIKTAFPNMDSSATEYNGLYRLFAKKLAILTDKQLDELTDKYKLEENSQGKYYDPLIQEQYAQKIINENSVKLSKPTGVGTVDDFMPIKKEYNGR